MRSFVTAAVGGGDCKDQQVTQLLILLLIPQIDDTDNAECVQMQKSFILTQTFYLEILEAPEFYQRITAANCKMSVILVGRG